MEMIQALDIALHGETHARNETPAGVWHGLLLEVEVLVMANRAG